MAKELTIVKIGGNVINDPDQLMSFLRDFSNLEGMKILVHGGGKKATEMADSLGLSPKMTGGRRITDAANLEVVTMVYAGLLNKNIVARLQAFNCNALGLSGADANVIKAHKRIVKEIDFGFAGDIDEVDATMISSFLDAGLSPVFSAITHDQNGQLLNTNADTIASEIAKAMSGIFKVDLIYCFEKSGVLRDVEDEDSIIEEINRQSYTRLVENGVIADGMLPKLKNCYEALGQGVDKVRIGKPDLIRNKEIKHTTLKL
ncbi:acetylglutamate kinase [Lutimonas saemankumensis]|uniref:acetylglutamate kinase n=1 Tax=Lutimonas saemankumensis TaxID=483016 RepID=UPI001CD41ABB|nr:acetylglutamate kinase [Lutimonas saemankumensis]MCA0933474.1 acetylglutamate kinase [Lutimonas saemankumensis]